MVVYIDRLFFINAVVDYLLLLTAAQLMGLPLRRGRYIIVSVIGGLYGAAAMVFPLLGQWWAKCAVGLVIALIAYWRETERWRAMALFFLLSGAMAGAMLAVTLRTGQGSGTLYFATVGWRTLLLSAAGFYGLLTVLFYQKAKHGGGELMEMTVDAFGRQCRIQVLRDSGDVLRNPVDGQPVLVAESEAVRSLLPEAAAAIIMGGDGPEEALDRDALEAAIREFVYGLPTEQKRMFIGRYFYFDPLREVAAYCGVRESKAKSMLFRLRKRLKEYLETEGFMV